jgi:energy-coupling factor transporter transmembrane protein EcfT
MTLLDDIAGFAEAILMLLVDQVKTVDPAIFAAIFILLIVFAAFSRRLPVFLGAGLLALIGFLILLIPSSAPTLIAIGAGCGSLLITFAGIRSRRRQAMERENLNKLTHSIRGLEMDIGRHLSWSITARSRQAQHEPVAPSEVPEKK